MTAHRGDGGSAAPTVRVTEAGAAALPYARAALAAVAAVRDTVDALTGLTRGHVTAGIVGAIFSPGGCS